MTEQPRRITYLYLGCAQKSVELGAYRLSLLWACKLPACAIGWLLHNLVMEKSLSNSWHSSIVRRMASILQI